MITGSAARNPEELGPGFLNIHKTLMSLYSALHQGMSAIYIMLPLRSVTASLSLPLAPSLSLSFSISLPLFFDMISFHKEPQSAAFSPVSLSAILWMLAICTDVIERTGYGRRKTEGEGEREARGLAWGVDGGELPFHHLYKGRIKGMSV